MDIKWKRVWFEGFMPHYVDTDLYDFLEEDIEARGGQYINTEDVTDITLDLGGMCRCDRKMETVSIDGLNIHMASEDLPTLYAVIKELPERHFDEDVDYYKIKTWPGFALVLDVGQKDRLIEWMYDLLPKCQAEVESEKLLWREAMGTGLEDHFISGRRNNKKEPNKC